MPSDPEGVAGTDAGHGRTTRSGADDDDGRAAPFALFEAVGVELEYMVVDSGDLHVRPIVDELIETELGEVRCDVERGAFAWSNELVNHVIELKTAAPVPTTRGLAAGFDAEVAAVESHLGPTGARLLGTGAHPFMDPATETRLWAHGSNEVYALYDRVFGCRGHGWSNLQSAHLNLPFRGDEEFGRLHAAVRVLLPLLPAMAASTPILDGADTGMADARLDAYRTNQARIPSLAGVVIPERVFTREDYERVIFGPIMRDMGPHDHDGVLDRHFLNSRGAIARFDRGSIEIRLLDLQECPAQDLGIIELVVEALRALTEGRWAGDALVRSLDERALADCLAATIAHGERALISHSPLRHALGWRRGEVTAGRLWGHVADEVGHALGPEAGKVVEGVLTHGTLSTRIRAALGAGWDAAALVEVYRGVADALRASTMFRG